MHIRPAEDGDQPAIAKIASANGDEGAESASDPGYVAHLRDIGRFLVAELDGGVAGYCATRPAGGATMLCDLFVDPARQGAGVGGALLGAVFEGAGERFTFASGDPRAMPLYARHGMVPWWPLLYLAGPPPGAAVLRAARVPPESAAAAEETLNGRDRRADYAYWAGVPGGTGVIVRDGGDVVAAGAAAPGRLIHLASVAGAAGPSLIAALGVLGSGPVRVCLPGPHPALPLLLAARWRIEDLDHHMSSRDGLVVADLVPSAALG